jgi:CRP-like cAMP-binding protein
MSTLPERLSRPPRPGILELPGDEAVLPAGSRLADEERPGRQCFVIIDGRAAVERGGARLRSLDSGDFVGQVDAGGGPLPPAGVTVRLETRARVLVIDSGRLAALIDTEPAIAAAWRSLIASAG